MDDIVKIFHQKMLQVYEKAKDQDYFANYFKGMLDQYGGMETAKRLLAKSQLQTGLFRLWELKMLDSSMESLVIQELKKQYHHHQAWVLKQDLPDRLKDFPEVPLRDIDWEEYDAIRNVEMTQSDF